MEGTTLGKKIATVYNLRSAGSDLQENPNRNAKTTLTVDDPDSTEISIFDAEKYFNEINLLEVQKPPAINGGNRVLPADNVIAEPPRFSSASSSTIDGYSSFYRNYRTRSFRSAATPTASSEASWNSQTGLLSVQPGSMAVSLRSPLSPTDKKLSSKSSPASPSPSTSFRWLNLRRKSCPCSCKKSVQVNEKTLRKRPENLPPPQKPKPSAENRLSQHGSQVLRGVSKSSSMAEIRTVSMEKPHTNRNYHENWCQTTRREQRNPSDTRSSFSSSSNIDPPRLQVLHENKMETRGSAMGIRSSFTDQRGGGNSSTTTGFTFPILNENGGIKPTVLKDTVEDPARDSLEVFRPSHDNHQQSKTATVLVSSRKNSDQFPRSDRPIHQVFTFPASPNSRLKSTVDVDDVASDASSDLFEIESFSTQTTTTTTTTATPAAMFLCRRNSMDEATAASSSFQALRRLGPNAVLAGLYDQRTSLDEPMTPTMDCCYEPSEASIDWSVTTAEGFDRASVANASEADYGDLSAPEVPMPAPEKSRRRSSSNGGLLMSCRCEKAVSVGQPGPRPVKPVGSSLDGYAGDQGRLVGPGISSSTLAMWVVGHKL